MDFSSLRADFSDHDGVVNPQIGWPVKGQYMPVSIACLGLLYSKADGLIGQERKEGGKINMIDLALLPLTPIMVMN
jgi:hypothetical protein